MVGPAAAQALELLFLQNTQQFGLQGQWNITYLIEKERSFVGHLKTAYLLRNRACECALLMAKQLAFQQIERDGSAVQLDERTSAPRADVVDRARNQLLTCARFSLNKNGGIRRRTTFNLVEHRFQRRAVTDELREPALA